MFLRFERRVCVSMLCCRNVVYVFIFFERGKDCIGVCLRNYSFILMVKL
jgi:hypothetical protein